MAPRRLSIPWHLAVPVLMLGKRMGVLPGCPGFCAVSQGRGRGMDQLLPVVLAVEEDACETPLKGCPDVAVWAHAPGFSPRVGLATEEFLEHAQGAHVAEAEVERPGNELRSDDGPCLDPGGREGWAVELAPEA